MTSEYVEKVLDRFIEQYQGKSIDFDGAYGPQSPDLIAAYMAALTGRERPYPYAYALDLWPDITGHMEAAGFERVVGDYERGDILVFGDAGGIGTLGIYTDPGSDYFPGLNMFTQNPGPARIIHVNPDSPLRRLLGAWRLTAGAECVKVYDEWAGGRWKVEGATPEVKAFIESTVTDGDLRNIERDATAEAGRQLLYGGGGNWQTSRIVIGRSRGHGKTAMLAKLKSMFGGKA